MSLVTVLNVSWWVILGVFLALLFLDGLLFHLYGLGYAEPSVVSPVSSGITGVNAESIRNTAHLIEMAQAQFTAPPRGARDLSNPFRQSVPSQGTSSGVLPGPL